MLGIRRPTSIRCCEACTGPGASDAPANPSVVTATNGDAGSLRQANPDEIQKILRDPTISKVLQDMQNDPKSGQAAMRDPTIRSKIETLIAAGVLGVK